MRGRLVRGLWNFWVSICAALLILVLLEGAARATLLIYRVRVAHGDVLEFEETLRGGATGATHWAMEYIEEFTAIQTQWHPYVYWRVAPRRGKHINVDRAGVRHTWNSTPAPEAGQRRIFMIGGSGMWGAGARDEFTIPSLVAKKTGRAETW